jgi:hypothetical protein
MKHKWYTNDPGVFLPQGTFVVGSQAESRWIPCLHRWQVCQLRGSMLAQIIHSSCDQNRDANRISHDTPKSSAMITHHSCFSKLFNLYK